jgi:hypothetical protein
MIARYLLRSSDSSHLLKPDLGYGSAPAFVHHFAGIGG